MNSFTVEERRHIRLLTHAESQKFESMSLGRFPQTNWGTIDWGEVPGIEQHVVSGEPAAAELMKMVIQENALEESDVVVFWANLVVPTLLLPAKLVIKTLAEVLATSHDVWLYFPAEGILFESFHEGRVTVARLSA